jgi:hypothetical protein
MKKGEKIALVIGGIALVGGIAYLAMQPKRPNVVYIPSGPSAASTSIAQGAAAAVAVTPVLENLFDSIFGDSNSGTTSGQDTSNLPSSYDNMNQMTGNANTISGTRIREWAGGAGLN